MGVLQEFMIDTQNHIFLFYGPMRSGKTSTVIKELMELEKHSPWQNKILSFRPKNDTRKTEESGSGKGFESLPNFYWIDPVNPYEDIFIALNKHGIFKTKKYHQEFGVGIDEVGFFNPSLIDVIMKLSDMEIKIILSTLEKDYRGYPFAIIETLLALVPHKWQTQFSSCCEYIENDQKCKYPGRYTQRETLVNGVWRPSSFFEATIIPEGKANENFCRYKVVCAQHHQVRHMPSDAFEHRTLYTQKLQKFDTLFAQKKFDEYDAYQKQLIEDAQKRNVVKK